MARRQRHGSDFARIPGTDNEAPAVGVFFDLGDDIVNLVDAPAIGRAPVGPLRTIHAAQIAGFFVGPFIPDAHAVVVEPFDVGIAAQEPEQFINDRLGMHLLGGEQREGVAQRKPDLRAKERVRAGAGAVGLELAVFHDVSQQIEVLNHAGKTLTARRGKGKKLDGEAMR